MSNKILAVNAGSSSIKFKLYLMPEEELLISGEAENIGQSTSQIAYTINKKRQSESLPLTDHASAIENIIQILENSGIIKEKAEITGVGHRISHGGNYYTQAVQVDADVEAKIDELKVLSPLHNPNGLAGIKAFEKFLPQALEVVSFDTSFHQTLPEKAFVYALPYEYYEKYHIRKYGFHGQSHYYVSQEARRLFGLENTRKIISCHLGNGSSITAIRDGHSINTSMGFTPLAGVVMGTRSGDIDPEILPYLEETLNLDSHQIRDILNTQSGLYGISGVSNDVRQIQTAATQGNQRAQLALTIFTHSIQQYIGAYATDLNGLDTLIFTAGIGEHSATVREMICRQLGYLGVQIDPDKNAHDELVISRPDSPVKVAVIPTNEELVIARDVMKFINN